MQVDLAARAVKTFEKETNMKRFLIFLTALALIVSGSIAMVGAADYENDASILTGVQLHALFINQGGDLFSDLAEEYYELWWEEEDAIEDTYFSPATINMRGFAMSPNGDYAYLGTLNGGDGLRGVVVLNTTTGVCTDLYYHRDPYPEGTTEPVHGPFSYGKGIDVDNRGYVYVGFAFSQNYNVVNLGIAKQENDGTLTEVSFSPIWENGVHGDTAGTHVGVNGVDVVHIGDKVYCYVVVNYDYDAIYCFDVTDPAKPVLNEEFGEGGFINFSASNCPVAVDGKSVSELQYLDVEEDGTVWVVMNPVDATTGVMRISPDGTECTSFYDGIGDGNIYSVSCVGNFLLCGSKSGSDVFVVDKETGEQLGSFFPADIYGDRVTRIAIRNDIMFVCCAGADSNAFNAIYAGALSDDGMDYLRNMIKSINGEFETDPPAEETKETVVETDDLSNENPDTTPHTDSESTVEPQPETTADTATETTADTAKPADTATVGGVDKSEKGCASALISCGSVVTLLAAAFVASKRRS